MANSIVSKLDLPRAIAKEKNGIVLYWVEELGLAGVHINGLALLLQCNPKTAKSAIEAVTQITLFEAEIVTEQGLRTVTLLSETDLATVLRYISRSKCKEETRDRADDVRDKLASAGFKLMVMMELAPSELAARAVSHLDKEIELEKTRNEGRKLEADKANSEHQLAIAETNLLSFRHLVTTTMPEVKQKIILGFDIVEKIEYRDRIIQNNQILDDGETVNKTDLCQRYDIKTRNGSPDYKRLNALLDGAKLPSSAWEETTTIRSNYQLRREYLDNLDRHVLGSSQQMHIGQ